MANPPKKHVVDIFRPRKGSLDSQGQESGDPLVIAEGVPCSIEELSGRELELTRQLVADATLRVRLFHDRAWNLTTEDYLRQRRSGGTWRQINIGAIRFQDESELELSCMERK